MIICVYVTYVLVFINSLNPVNNIYYLTYATSCACWAEGWSSFSPTSIHTIYGAEHKIENSLVQNIFWAFLILMVSYVWWGLKYKGSNVTFTTSDYFSSIKLMKIIKKDNMLHQRNSNICVDNIVVVTAVTEFHLVLSAFRMPWYEAFYVYTSCMVNRQGIHYHLHHTDKKKNEFS